jgi:hypothetical protein
MSINQQNLPPAGPPPYGGPPYGGPPMPPVQPPKSTSGVAIAGFILAFLIAPLGLILSIVGLVQTGGGRRKGKGLAIAGVVISLLLIIGSGALILAVGNKVATLADPGCTTGKAAILDNADKLSSQDTIKDGLQTTITGLASAQAKAKHDNVRNAMKALDDDYTQLLSAVTNGTQPAANLQAKIDADAKTIDSLCSVGN